MKWFQWFQCEIFILFNDDERQAGAWMYSSSRHVERTNSRRI